LLKTFVDDESYNSGHGHAYEKYGVDVQEGAIAIVRPDQCKWFCFSKMFEIACANTLFRCLHGYRVGRPSGYWGLLRGLCIASVAYEL
jgi:hypothetical protein